MPNHNPAVFTKKEAITRLQELKYYLSVKSRIVYLPVSGIDSFVPVYEPTLSQELFGESNKLQLELESKLPKMLEHLASIAATACSVLPETSTSNCLAPNVVYLNPELRKVGSFICAALFTYGDKRVTKIVSYWMGTWDIAPRLTYTIIASHPFSDRTIHCEKLPKYADLV